MRNNIIAKSEVLINVVKYSDGIGGIDISTLTPEQREQCREITRDVKDLSTLYEFGSDLAQAQVQASHKLLEMNKIDKCGEVGKGVMEVLEKIRETEYKDPSNMKGVRGFVAKYVPFVGTSLVKKADKVLIEKYESSKGVVDKVTSALYKQGLDLKEDYNTLEIMEESTKNYIYQLYLHIVALEQKIQDTKEELKEVKESNQVDDFEVRRLQEFIDCAEQHKLDLYLLGETNKNVTLNEIAIMKQNCYNLYKNACSLKTTVIPQWEQSIAMAIINNRQKETADLQKHIKDVNNRMLIQNAEMAKAVNKQIMDEARRGAIDVESYCQAYSTILASMEETMKSAEEAAKKREASFKKIAEINEKNKQAMKKLISERETKNFYNGTTVISKALEDK